MQVIKYYQAENQAHWLEEIGKGDWSAAELLHDWLKSGQLKKICGSTAEVYLLTDDDKLVSFATLAPQDEIDAPELTPWIGFVYTFPAYRGKRNSGKLINHICDVLKLSQTKKVYISSDEIGLYEKYGFTFWRTMTNREGKPTRVYVKTL